MNLPKSLKIGYKDYDIQELDPKHASDLDIMGDCHNAESRIRVLICDNPWDTINTLVHETFHAVYALQSLEEGDSEERVVNSMANGFVGVLRDNPDLLRMITDQYDSQKEEAGRTES